MKKLTLILLAALLVFHLSFVFMRVQAAAPDTLISLASGNLMTKGTWRVAETGASAQQLTFGAQTATTTSYVASSAFTCTNADILQGILLVGNRLTTSGTVTVGLSDDNGVTYTREVTVNASNIPADSTYPFFSFGASPYTCDGGADYKVAIKGSSAGNASFWRSAVAGNWWRIPVTTAAPASVAAGSILYIVGDWTAPDTGNTYTVTMNDTANTDFANVRVADRGILSSGTTAATAYTFKHSADLEVVGNGTLNMPGTDMPSDSSLDWTVDCTSNVQYGIWFYAGSTTNIHGNPLSYDRALLSADVAVNGTSLTTDVSTGWVSGDTIALASTTRTYNQYENGDLNGDAVGTTLTVHGFGGVGGGVAYAHSGTSPTQAEIVNLSRNVRIHGASAANQSYINVAATAVFSWDSAQIYWMGSNTASKRGMEIATTTGTFTLTNSSLSYFQVSGAIGVNISGSASDNYTISDNVFYSINTSGVMNAATTGTAWTVDNNIFIGYGQGTLVYLNGMTGTVTNNTAAGSNQDGMYFGETADATLGTVSGNTAHSNNRYGFNSVLATSTTGARGTISSSTSWRNTNRGFYCGWIRHVMFDGIVGFGNTTANFTFGDDVNDIWINNATLNGDSAFSTTEGIEFTTININIRLTNSSLGVAGGIKTTHSTADLYVVTGGTVLLDGNSVTLASGTPIGNLATTPSYASRIGISRYGGTANDHRTFLNYGSTTTDTTIFKVTPAERLNPETIGTLKYKSSPKYVALDNGNTATVSVWVYGSVAGDSEAYGGAHPRLMLEANPGLGYAADTVVDTRTVANGTWELLTGTVTATGDNGVLKLYMDCDGTTGFVTVDSWSATGKDPSGQKYWLYGLPSPGITPTGTGFGTTVSYGVAH